MSTEDWIILTNFGLIFVTLLASLLTMVEIHHEDQKTLRTLLAMLAGLIPKRKTQQGKGKHEE